MGTGSVEKLGGMDVSRKKFMKISLHVGNVSASCVGSWYFFFFSIKKALKATFLSEFDFKANNIDENVTNTMNSDTV